jgi:hypothetical protein
MILVSHRHFVARRSPSLSRGCRSTSCYSLYPFGHRYVARNLGRLTTRSIKSMSTSQTLSHSRHLQGHREPRRSSPTYARGSSRGPQRVVTATVSWTDDISVLLLLIFCVRVKIGRSVLVASPVAKQSTSPDGAIQGLVQSRGRPPPKRSALTVLVLGTG